MLVEGAASVIGLSSKETCRAVGTPRLPNMRDVKAGLHYATRLQATRRLRKVKTERCCLQCGCMQHLLHVYNRQHGCSDETLICLQATV